MRNEEVLHAERRIMDLYAPDYGRSTLTNSLPYQLERARFADWIAASCREGGLSPPATRLLDVGCGSGDLLQLLSARDFGELHGLDLSSRMLETARRALPRATFHCGDLADAGTFRSRVQVVTSFLTLHHLLDRSAFFALVDRVLAPGGWFFVMEYNARSWSRRPLLGDLLLAPAVALRVLLKLKNRRHLAGLAQLPPMFNPAHKLSHFEELRAAMPHPHAYELRHVSHGLWGAALKHGLAADSGLDRALLRAVEAVEARVVPRDAGHFLWIAGRRR